MALDPLSALSVVASVVQFVDFASKLVSKGVQVYNSVDGALIENVEVEHATERLIELSDRLRTSLHPGLQVAVSDSDQVLETICKRCAVVSSELIAHLEKLKVPTGEQHGKWRSYRKALKSVWSKEDLDAIAHKL
jgi:hypothetical protein